MFRTFVAFLATIYNASPFAPLQTVEQSDEHTIPNPFSDSPTSAPSNAFYRPSNSAEHIHNTRQEQDIAEIQEWLASRRTDNTVMLAAEQAPEENAFLRVLADPHSVRSGLLERSNSEDSLVTLATEEEFELSSLITEEPDLVSLATEESDLASLATEEEPDAVLPLEEGITYQFRQQVPPARFLVDHGVWFTDQDFVNQDRIGRAVFIQDEPHAVLLWQEETPEPETEDSDEEIVLMDENWLTHHQFVDGDRIEHAAPQDNLMLPPTEQPEQNGELPSQAATFEQYTDEATIEVTILTDGTWLTHHRFDHGDRIEHAATQDDSVLPATEQAEQNEELTLQAASLEEGRNEATVLTDANWLTNRRFVRGDCMERSGPRDNLFLLAQEEEEQNARRALQEVTLEQNRQHPHHEQGIPLQQELHEHHEQQSETPPPPTSLVTTTTTSIAVEEQQAERAASPPPSLSRRRKYEDDDENDVLTARAERETKKRKRTPPPTSLGTTSTSTSTAEQHAERAVSPLPPLSRRRKYEDDDDVLTAPTEREIKKRKRTPPPTSLDTATTTKTTTTEEQLAERTVSPSPSLSCGRTYEDDDKENALAAQTGREEKENTHRRH